MVKVVGLHVRSISLKYMVLQIDLLGYLPLVIMRIFMSIFIEASCAGANKIMDRKLLVVIGDVLDRFSVARKAQPPDGCALY